MKTAYIYPTNNSSNKYSALQEEAVKRAGFALSDSFKDFFKTDVYILNWFEALGRKHRSEFIKKMVKLFMFVLFKKRVFFVLHNRLPLHVKSKSDSIYRSSMFLMKLLIKISEKIIILCDDSFEVLKQIDPSFDSYKSKIIKIPHPNYIDVYGEPKTVMVRKKKNVNFLFVGAIKPYKNIDLLINAFNSLREQNVELTICGKVYDSDYEKHLLQTVNNPNIHCDFRFIPDEELVRLICQSDILILPYSLASSLNSGTIILTFSCKKTVLAPMIGTLKEYDDSSFFYSYTYDSEQDHADALMRQIMTVVGDVKNNPNVLEQKGLKAFSLVKEENSLDLVSKLYKQILL